MKMGEKRYDRIRICNISLLVAAMLVLFAAGCARTLLPVPRNLTFEAEVANLHEIRSIVERPSPAFQRNLLKSFKQERPNDFPPGPDGIRLYPTLALSGGGANGAYGAGLLNGWTQEGSRPVFKVVTGISTGALIAPLAFLGSEYDGKLKEFYTTMSSKDIFKKKGIFGAIGGNSLASTKPLARLIAKSIDEDILKAVAEAHARGRRLYIGTTILDSEQFAIWDMGAIASTGPKQALPLFRKIMLASASIPVLFPPVFFDVEAGGQRYREMHVDGGVSTQVFFVFGALRDFDSDAREMGLDPSKIGVKLYIIRNGKVGSTWRPVENATFPIAERSIGSLTRMQGFSDLYRLYAITKAKGGDFYLAYIPNDYVPAPKEAFDPVEMNRLFDLGFKEAVNGYPWRKYPPYWKEIVGDTEAE